MESTTMGEHSSSSRFIGTANQGFAQQAQEEVRRLFGTARCSYLVNAEIFLMELPVSQEEAISTLMANEPMFLRHIQPVMFDISLTGDSAELEIISKQVEKLEALRSYNIAVQIRKGPEVKLPYDKQDLKSIIDHTLTEHLGCETVARGADWILSVYMTEDNCYMGYSKPAENLSDWAGGAIRYQKEEGQISRAKFKLLEAEQRFGFSLAQFHEALDVGAAPGGWTSLLLERGLKVTAIDPAKLSPTLKGNLRLTFMQKNASEVKLISEQFDLLVCDMSWNPKQTAKLVGDLLYAVKTGGTLILTVKLMHRKAFQTVREVMSLLEDKVTLIQGKQLFHNREELTLYLLKQH